MRGRGRSLREQLGLEPLGDGHLGIQAPQGQSPLERPGLGPLEGSPHGRAAAVSRLSRSDSLMLSFLSYFFCFLVILFFI